MAFDWPELIHEEIMPEDFPIFESSPEMKAAGMRGRRDKYPWKSLLCGRSFVVGKADDVAQNHATLLTLQSLCYRHGKTMGKSFRVIERADHFEVGRTDTGTNTGSFSTAPGPEIAREAETLTPAAPMGWPVLDKTK